MRDRRIIELDAVSLEEKTSALAACEVLCVPSVQESFGGVFVEAWKMGKPVIGADIPAVAEVISDGVDGFIGQPNAAFLAEKLLTLLSDAPLRERMGKAGLEKAQSCYDWSIIANRIEDVYRAVGNW